MDLAQTIARLRKDGAEQRKLMRRVIALLETDITNNTSLSIEDFCRVERISRWQFYELVKQQRAPRLMRHANQCIRISPQARLDWHRKREAEAAASQEAPDSF
jgi:hypothetical protein